MFLEENKKPRFKQFQAENKCSIDEIKEASNSKEDRAIYGLKVNRNEKKKEK